MNDTVRRGYDPQDEAKFTGSALLTLRRAADDLYCLLNRGYPLKSASVFVGNLYLLTERQRLALVRSVSSEEDIRRRKEKELTAIPPGEEAHIDGFNTVITLEVALSGSPVLQGMDGAVRDLAGLRGTYHIIDKTEPAVRLILRELVRQRAGMAHFYLDAPVSNSGRLKALILELSEQEGIPASVDVINNVDTLLQTKPNVITGDSIILDRCESWFNLTAAVLWGIDGVWKIECY